MSFLFSGTDGGSMGGDKCYGLWPGGHWGSILAVKAPPCPRMKEQGAVWGPSCTCHESRAQPASTELLRGPVHSWESWAQPALAKHLLWIRLDACRPIDLVPEFTASWVHSTIPA